jgi:hypothetical protein
VASSEDNRVAWCHLPILGANYDASDFWRLVSEWSVEVRIPEKAYAKLATLSGCVDTWRRELELKHLS